LPRTFYITFFIIFASTLNAIASCNFITGNFIEKLNDPSHIKEIIIETPKSGKYYKNFVKIHVLDSIIIPKELKIKYSANITVIYDFGKCRYTGKVRQNGDLKDHIDFSKEGNPLRSLVVDLNDGNILNAVKFKLLLPSTRNGINEVLGTILLKEAGFITPETFEVQTKINGVSNIMLFQEGLRKELIERNNRREGPIYEGDEDLIWTYKDFEMFALENLSLSKMMNGNWFLKGDTSRLISLNAYEKIQLSYLRYSQIQNDYQDLKLSPNLGLVFEPNENKKLFSNYFFNLLSMNGDHGLRPHNRRFYYNTFIQEFEPIYYDGNLNLTSKINVDLFKRSSRIIEFFEYVPIIENLISLEDTFNKFKKRTLIDEKKAREFFNISINNILENEKLISSFYSKPKKYINYNLNKNQDLIKSYLSESNKNKLSQYIFLSLERKNNTNIYEAFNYDGLKFDLSIEDVEKILSKNKFNDKRAILMPNKKPHSLTSQYSLTPLPFNNSLIKHSNTLKVNIDFKSKTLTLTQKYPNDWALISNSVIDGWSIIFIGKGFDKNFLTDGQQRFNEFGLTGCLNLYKSNVTDVLIKINKGMCEDSLNIISSSGNLSSIEINDSFADALDFDTSLINIDSILIKNASNDCIDLSSGIYNFNYIKANKCGDKGVSIGEKSNVQITKLDIKNSNIGVSSKDYSSTKIINANIFDSMFCLESKQKKQEYGGSKLLVNTLTCPNKVFFDEKSVLKVGNIEF
jgi:hypothetical protein